MPFLAAVTQPSWIDTLEANNYTGEVNFWRPGTTPLASSHYGKPLVFVQKGKSPRRVRGYGIIERYESLTLSAAWARWGIGNGVSSPKALSDQVRAVAHGANNNKGRLTNPMAGMNTVIGCVILSGVVILPNQDSPTVSETLPDFHDRIVQYKAYAGDLPPQLMAVAFHAPALMGDDSPRGIRPISEEEKAVIEELAMDRCRTLFAGWTVDDVSRPQDAKLKVGNPHPGYDLRIRRDKLECHAEVKGTTSHPPTITITRNELSVAASDPNAALFILSGIKTVKDSGGWSASGGQPALYRWIHAECLSTVLEGLRIGEPHRLTARTQEWDLEVKRTDLLQPVQPDQLSAVRNNASTS